MAGAAPSSRLATGQIGRNERHRIYASDHLGAPQDGYLQIGASCRGGRKASICRNTNDEKVRIAGVVFALVAGMVLAQRGYRGGYGGRGFRRGSYEDHRTPREIIQRGNETPTWTNAPGFENDVFTFVRMKRARGPYSYGGPWDTDTPDSDLNLSYRLQQVTSLKVDPNGLFLRLTEEELSDYPFIYMVEPGSLYLTDAESFALR